MSELILKIDADEAGLRAVREATKHLKEVLSSGGLKGSTEDIRALETSLKGLSVQAAATQKEMTGLTGGLKQVVSAQAEAAASTKGVTAAAKEGTEKLSLLGMKYTQLATAAQKYSVLQIDGAMRKDAASVDKLSHSVGALGIHLSDLVAQQRAEKNALLLTNVEYEKQVNIRTIVAAKTSEELGIMVEHTQALLRDSVARGELTAQEAVALGVKDRQIIAEAEYQALLSKGASARAGYAAQAMAEATAAARLIGAPLSGKSAKGSASVFSENFAPPPEAAAQVKGLSAAYAGLAKEQELAIAMNRGWTASHNAGVMAEATSNLRKMGVATTETARATRGLHDATRGLAGASGALWLSYGNLLPMMAGYVTMAAAIKGVKLNADFESTTIYTQAIAEATGDYSMSLTTLREKLLAVREVQDTAGELAAASKELVKAGFSEAQAVGEIADMSRTATVVQEDLADVTKGVAAQYRAWNVEAVGAERGVSSLKQVANQMGFAAAASATDFGELNSMLAYTTELGPITAAGFSELLAALAGMTNMGIRGTKAATGLRSAILNLQHPSEKLAGELSRLKVPFSSTTDQGELKNLTTLFDDLGKSLAPLSDKARVDILESIFSVRSLKGGAAMLTMLSNAAADGKFNFRGLTEEIENAGRKMVFIDESAKKINDSLEKQWGLLKADVAREFTKSFEDANGAARGLVDALRQAAADGTLRSLIDTVASLTSGMISLVKYAVEFKDEIGAYGKAFAAAAVISGMASMLDYLGKLRLAQLAWNTASLANPLIALGAAGIWLVQQAYESGQDQEAYAERANAASKSTLGGRGVRTESRGDGMRSGHSSSPVVDFASQDGFQRALAGESALLRHSTSSQMSKPSAARGTDEREASSSVQAAADKAARLQEWHVQRGLQLEEIARKAKADIREASLKDSLAFADAEHKALLFGDEEYLNKTRKLRQENLQAKLDDAIASEITLSAKVSEAQAFANKNKDSQKAQQDLAKYQDQLTAVQATLRVLSADAAAMPEIIRLEDITRLNAAKAAYRSLADTAREMRENSQIERSVAGMNEADAKKVRDLRKIDLELERELRKLELSRNRYKADGSDSDMASNLKAGAAAQKSATRQVYEDEAATRGDWLAGAKKGWEDYSFTVANTFKTTGDIVGRVFTNMEDVFINFVKTGKLNFSDLVDSMISDMLRMSAQQAVSGMATSVVTMLAGAWAGSGGITAAAAPNTSYVGSYDSMVGTSQAFVFHDGGVVGGPAPSRRVPASLFSSAPRFHDGLAPDEFPAILQSGERVQSRKEVAQGGPSITVNLIEAPGKGGQVQQRQDSNGGGNIIDIMVEQIEGKLASRVSQGRGLAPVLEGRYALNPAFGMTR